MNFNNIALIDDQQEYRYWFSSLAIFQDLELNCYTFQNISDFRQSNQKFDLIFLDLNLSGENSLAFLDYIDNRKVIIHSVYVEPSLSEFLNKKNVLSIIPKSFDFKNIEDFLKRLKMEDTIETERIINFESSVDRNKLTKSETSVLKLILEGKNSKSICLALDMKTSTLKYHKSNIYKKVGSKKINDLANYYLKNVLNQVH